MRDNKNFYYIHAVNILLLTLGNFLFIKAKYLSTADSQTFYSALLYLISSFIIFSLITSISRFLFIAINSLLYILASLASYFVYYYGIVISPTLIQSIVNTDQSEVFELLNLSLVLWILISGIAPCVALVTTVRLSSDRLLFFSNINHFIKLLLLSFVLIIVSFTIIGHNITALRILNNSLPSFAPYNYIFALKNYLNIYKNNNKATQKLSDIFSYKIDSNIKQGLKIVLIIGESARSDHFQINGYERPTNPKLMRVDNIIYYKNAYSNATNTPLGVQAIMKMGGNYDASSFIDIFNSLGFDTYWISNQGTKYKIINNIATESNVSVFSDEIRASKIGNNYDEDLLPLIQKIATNDDPSLVIIHTMGSHRLYDLRYPPEFKKFTPTCIKDQLFYSSSQCTNHEELINSYDNSILYTDHFISEVIDIFADNKALIIYISDHGESLGENGIYAHAHPMELAPKEQLHIPLILWASASFLDDKNLNYNFEIAKNNQDLYVDQTYMLHSILDCLNIKSQGIHLNKSLCKAD
jgi:lipid A ethanolaminephosphotransferase